MTLKDWVDLQSGLDSCGQNAFVSVLRNELKDTIEIRIRPYQDNDSHDYWLIEWDMEAVKRDIN